MNDGVMRILVVEDNPDDAHLVRLALSNHKNRSFELFFTDNLSSGLEHLSSGRVDAVLLDLGLPDSQGLAGLARIKSHSPKIPIVVLTGSCNGDRAREAIRSGAQDFVVKGEPGFESLPRSVTYAVERSRSAMEIRELNEMLERLIRKRTNEIEAARASFNAIVERSADAILVVDQQGTTRYVNPAAAKLFDRPSEDLVGEQFGLPVVPEEMVEVEIRREENRVLVAELRSAETEWNHEPAFVTSLRDVTERTEMRAKLAQADRMASVGTLAAGVAHEINNPLAYVLYNLQSLVEDLRQASPDKLEQALLDDMVARADEAAEGATRISAIVRGLKTFSRQEEDRRTPVGLNQVIDSAVNMAYNEIRYRSRLVKDYGEIPPVLGSEGRLSQVFLNLLVNAAQAIEEGDVESNEIEVKTWTDGTHVFAEVADTGRGIPKDNLKQLFDPFFTTKPPGVGSGLGLSICHNYVKAYGGRIEVDSEAGRGSRFSVVLPVYSEERHGHEAVPEPAEKTSHRPPARRGRILVVDDEPMIGSTMKRILRPDHDVISATSGLEGKEILDNDPSFNLILCDLMMPDFSGMDLYTWVKERHPEFTDRFVFITGGAFTPMANEFLQRIDNPRLEKPFDPEDLKETICVLLDRLGNTGESATGK